MESKIIWDNNSNIVYGEKSNFNNKLEFIQYVKAEHKKINKYDCYVDNLKLQVYIITKKGINANSIVPISDTDIKIVTMYSGNFASMEGLSGN
ncbi:hypothetical protein [Clostridium weizhouense]|uniref:Uncharacterized protein n=1 Tax=Clostridium weizhouense TaxID=2859781 RepID=A0ABS7APC1_9CLOT|nr:hypothetical protein [Clostridium weizhouense]MBW6409546.1 hypothetical protein [Clostridium weizhouense]